MPNKNPEDLEIDDVLEFFKVRAQSRKKSHEEKEKLIKKVAVQDKTIAEQKKKINKLESTSAKKITELQATIAAHATTISDLRSRLDHQEKLASKCKAEYETGSKEIEKKLAAKEAELTAAVLKTNELQKKYEQSKKTISPIKSTTQPVIPAKRPHEEETSLNVTEWVRYLKSQLGERHSVGINEWRTKYEQAEMLEGSLGQSDAYRRQECLKSAEIQLRALKQRIVVENRRAQELHDLGSR